MDFAGSSFMVLVVTAHNKLEAKPGNISTGKTHMKVKKVGPKLIHKEMKTTTQNPLQGQPVLSISTFRTSRRQFCCEADIRRSILNITTVTSTFP